MEDINRSTMEMIVYIAKQPAEDINRLVQKFYAILEEHKQKSPAIENLDIEHSEEFMVALELIVQVSKDRLNLNDAETNNKRKELITRYTA